MPTKLTANPNELTTKSSIKRFVSRPSANLSVASIIISMLISLQNLLASAAAQLGNICLHEEYSIAKPRQTLNFSKSVWESLTRWPFTRDCSKQPHSKCQTVEKHVYTIAQKTEGICNESVKRLNDHKGKIKTGRVSMVLQWLGRIPTS